MVGTREVKCRQAGGRHFPMSGCVYYSRGLSLSLGAGEGHIPALRQGGGTQIGNVVRLGDQEVAALPWWRERRHSDACVRPMAAWQAVCTK